jgi:hypothetical protein
MWLLICGRVLWSWPRLSRSHRYERLTCVSDTFGEVIFWTFPRAAASVAWPSRRSGFSAGVLSVVPDRQPLVNRRHNVPCGGLCGLNVATMAGGAIPVTSSALLESTAEARCAIHPSGRPSPPRPRRPESSDLSRAPMGRTCPITSGSAQISSRTSTFCRVVCSAPASTGCTRPRTPPALVGRFRRRVGLAVLPDAPPTNHTFPMRNAKMSGLVRASVILVAVEYSDSRIQARLGRSTGAR